MQIIHRIDMRLDVNCAVIIGIFLCADLNNARRQLKDN